jgi:hypothetical protein
VVNEEGIERTADINVSAVADPAIGVTGITFHQSRCVVAIQSHTSKLVVLDQGLNVETIYQLDDVGDIHGIASYGDEIILASTGTNQIMAFDLRTRAVRVVWAGADSLTNTLHLNDLAVLNERIFCSQFGLRVAHAMRSGAIFEAHTGEPVVTHLREPHSIVATEEAIFILESASGDLIRIRDRLAPVRVLGIAGYARGLAISGTHYAIGKSGYRSNPRHRLGASRLAALTHSATIADAMQVSGVFVVDRSTHAFKFIDTTAIGPEIYQIMALPADFLIKHPIAPEATYEPEQAPTTDVVDLPAAVAMPMPDEPDHAGSQEEPPEPEPPEQTEEAAAPAALPEPDAGTGDTDRLDD